MDFFAQQDHARASTRRMLVLYTITVIGVVVTLNVVAAVAWHASKARATPHRRFVDAPGVVREPIEARNVASSPASFDWPLHAITTAAVLGIIAIATLVKQAEIGGDGANVAELLGGRALDGAPTDLAERRLLNVVEEMSLASGVPMPRIYILQAEPGINAFAAGTRADRAVVCVTRGALDALSRDELQGVVAHEFSHILNGDMRLNLRLIALNFGIMAIGYLGLQLLRFSPSGSNHSSASRSRDDKGGGALVLLAVALAMAIVGYVGTLFGKMLQAAVSRQREYLADASAVQFTRNPDGICGALKRIGAFSSTLRSTSAGEASHLFFAEGVSGFLDGLFATHPPLDQRIRAIEPSFDGHMTPREAPVNYDRDGVVAGLVAAKLRGDRAPVPLAETPPAMPIAATRSAFPPPLPLPLSSADADARAAPLVAAIPDALREAAREPYDARAIALALLLDRDAVVRTRQLAMIERVDPAAVKLTAEHAIAVESAGATARLPILDLALPALVRLSPTQQADFRTLCRALAAADQVLSPFELSLFKVVDHALPATGDDGVKFASVSAVAPEAGVILSTLAMAGGVAQAEAAFAAGIARLQLARPPTLNVDYDAPAFAAALSNVRLATVAVRRRIVDAATRTVTFDGNVRVEELELLRAACAAFDVPIPPLAPLPS